MSPKVQIVDRKPNGTAFADETTDFGFGGSMEKKFTTRKISIGAAIFFALLFAGQSSAYGQDDYKQWESDQRARRQQWESDRRSRRQQWESDRRSSRQQWESDRRSRRQQAWSDRHVRRQQFFSDRRSLRRQFWSDRRSRRWNERRHREYRRSF
jgi:hypothetical protein